MFAVDTLRKKAITGNLSCVSTTVSVKRKAVSAAGAVPAVEMPGRLNESEHWH